MSNSALDQFNLFEAITPNLDYIIWKNEDQGGHLPEECKQNVVQLWDFRVLQSERLVPDDLHN